MRSKTDHASQDRIRVAGLLRLKSIGQARVFHYGVSHTADVDASKAPVA